MAQGIVKWFDLGKGYGFVNPDDGSHDVFVHISAVKLSGLDELKEGQRLEFELHQRGDGRTFVQSMKLLVGLPADQLDECLDEEEVEQA
jgi:CspA family cold shock protein